jgi:hypothetical protein
VDAGDQLVAADDLARDAAEADVVARLLREEHLVSGLDPGRLRADRGDDARTAAASALCGMMSPLRVSTSSSTGSTIRWSSSGSRLSVRGAGSSTPGL